MSLIWGAIALVALQFAASAALAHGGHHHPPIAHFVEAGHDHAAQRAHVERAHVQGTEALFVATEVSAAPFPDQSNPVGTPCNGACCSLQHSCAGSAIGAAPPLNVAPAPDRIAAVGYAASAPLGLDPDIPPKPPKFFA